MKTTKSWYPGLYLNPGPPDYEAGVLTNDHDVQTERNVVRDTIFNGKHIYGYKGSRQCPFVFLVKVR
jgi:hypothetical protein